MTFDSLILDIDGTIWNTTGIVAEAWNRMITKYYPEVPLVSAEILAGQFGNPMNVIADNLYIGLNQAEKDDLMEKCCEEERKGINSNTKNITYPNVVKTIKALSKKIPVFIVSNCQSGYIEIVMEKNGIKECIKDFECYGGTGQGKAYNISLIVKRNGLKNPVYVGDTQMDADACKGAEIPFIWASYGFGKPDFYDAKIADFGELVKYF